MRLHCKVKLQTDYTPSPPKLITFSIKMLIASHKNKAIKQVHFFLDSSTSCHVLALFSNKLKSLLPCCFCEVRGLLVVLPKCFLIFGFFRPRRPRAGSSAVSEGTTASTRSSGVSRPPTPSPPPLSSRFGVFEQVCQDLPWPQVRPPKPLV